MVKHQHLEDFGFDKYVINTSVAAKLFVYKFKVFKKKIIHIQKREENHLQVTKIYIGLTKIFIFTPKITQVHFHQNFNIFF